jgi:uncharacterized protein (TIGR02466 family)
MDAMNLASLFSTPVAAYDYENMADMNRELTRILVAESQTVPSLTHSNVGSWHSPYNLHTRQEAVFQMLAQLVTESAWKTSEALAQAAGKRLKKLPYRMSMWAMVMREGHHTLPHTHASAHWSIVYYPDVGDTGHETLQRSGKISFLDPRSSYLPIPGLDCSTGEFEVAPKTGQMLVFPGWLPHFVHLYRGTRPRVSIACNVSYMT